MADGGIGNQSPATIFQARLKTDLAGVSNTLTLGQCNGNKVVVSGQTVTIPTLGLTTLVTDHLITAAGADSGAAGVASTLYYVYLSNKKATFAPGTIRLSATPPTLVNGVKYLGNAGNALNWRFVGWVRLNGTPQFESSQLNALIVNQYNQRQQSIFATPGYNDGVDFGSFSQPAAAVWAAAASGPSRISFISDGISAARIRCSAIVEPQGVGVGDMSLGIGVDSTTTSPVQTNNNFNGSGVWPVTTPPYDPTLAEGYHTLDMVFVVTGAPSPVFTTIVKAGNPTHPFVTIIEALVWV
jgi:hypothetical protein